MDPFVTVVAALPRDWQPWALVALLLIVVLCALISAFVPPPPPTSRWAGLYALVARVGLNIGWAVNAYQSGRSSVMAPIADASRMRTLVAERTGVPREETKP